MEDFMAMRTSQGLVPMEAQDRESFEALPFGKPIRIKATQARSSPRNRWFHASLQLLFGMQDVWPTFTLFRNEVKKWLGLFDLYIVRETEHYEYHSIAFDKMDESDFIQICDRFVKLVCVKIIPNLDEQDARSMLNMLDADSGKLGNRTA